MASAGGHAKLLGGVVAPVVAAAVGVAAWRIDWPSALRAFFTGEGRTMRLVLLASVVLNLKGLPLAWTTRVFSALYYHTWIRPPPPLTPRSLFAPMITTSHVTLLEVDYNIHKSNSTYFADMDVSRSHLAGYLCREGGVALRNNATTKIVKDPATGAPFVGKPVIVLGAAACSFRREIKPYARYEMWSHVLAWDRKWLYIATHFVPVGVARPTEWLDARFGLAGVRKGEGEKDWSTKVYASAVSKYVFKLGRLTVHPAIILEASGLLPARPGGWTSGPEATGEVDFDFDDEDGESQEWTWQRVEKMRRKGMEMAAHFAALDGLGTVFDGGDNGAIGSF